MKVEDVDRALTKVCLPLGAGGAPKSCLVAFSLGTSYFQVAQQQSGFKISYRSTTANIRRDVHSLSPRRDVVLRRRQGSLAPCAHSGQIYPPALTRFGNRRRQGHFHFPYPSITNDHPNLLTIEHDARRHSETNLF